MPMPTKSANRSGKSTPTSRGGEKDKTKEEDTIAQDEEERRLAEEQQRLDLEKKEKEKAKLIELEALEASRREQQLKWTEDKLTSIRKHAEDLSNDARADSVWQRYMRCDGTPDPTVLTEINTYINLMRDTTENDINLVLEKARTIYALIYELNFILDDTPDGDMKPQQEQLYKSTILALQDLLMHRYNDGTLNILREAISEADSESGNLQKVVRGENEIIMLWGNLNKNPRFKSFTFDSENFTFELPKPLSMADIAVRNLNTQYDFYSHRCSTYYARSKKQKDPEIAAPEDMPTLETTEESQESPERRLSQENEVKDSSMGERRKSNGSEASESMNITKEKDGEEMIANQAEENDNHELTENDDIQDYDIDDDILDEDVIDLRQYHQLGGICHVDLLRLPPQAKTINGWTLRQVIDEPVTTVEYPSEEFAPKQSTSRATSAKEESHDPENPVKTPILKQTMPPVGITFQLPGNVMFFEEPQVAKWDEADLHWKTAGITDTEYDEDKRLLSFKTEKFGTFCLVQDLHVNMPFQQWEVRPLGQNHCLITITAAIAEAFIEIKGDACRLQAPEDKDSAASELTHLYEKWMTPRELKISLQKAGVNIFPAEDSDKFVSIQNKNIDLDNTYDQIALMSSCVAFTWSKWNATATKDQLVIQAAPWLGHGDTRIKEVLQGQFTSPTPPPPKLTEDDWSLFMVDGSRCHKLLISEYDDDFSAKISSDAEYHSDLIHVVTETPFPSRTHTPSKEEVHQRLESVHKMYVHTVMKILKATKCLTFS